MIFTKEDYFDVLAPPSSIVPVIKNFFDFKGRTIISSSSYFSASYKDMIWSFTANEENDHTLPFPLNIEIYKDYLPFYKVVFFLSGEDLDTKSIDFGLVAVNNREDMTQTNQYLLDNIVIDKQLVNNNTMRITLIVSDKINLSKLELSESYKIEIKNTGSCKVRETVGMVF